MLHDRAPGEMTRRRLPSPLELAVSHLDTEGCGVACYGNKPVRVKAALPGEQISARVVGRRKGSVLAVTEAVIDSPAQARQRSPCAFYPRCGGCSLQHMTYASQVEHKQQFLLAELKRQEVGYERLRTPVVGPQFGYRRKARLGVRQLHETVLVGFRESFGGRIVKMNGCVVLAPPFDALLDSLARLVSRLSQPDTIAQIETAVGDQTLPGITSQQGPDAAMILRHLAPLNTTDVRVLAEFERTSGVRVYTQSGGYETVSPLSEGPDYLHYALIDWGLDMRFKPTDFVQVNAVLNRALVAAVVAGVRPAIGEHVADLFCGIGNFSLPLARAGAKVAGFEAESTSIERACMNAAHNGLMGSVQFAVADLYSDTCTLDLGSTAALVLDPPRSGAGPQLATWLGRQLRRIVYVSCNPTTFATDAALLASLGFKLREVGIYDMFPQTAHVETLGLFTRHG